MSGVVSATGSIISFVGSHNMRKTPDSLIKDYIKQLEKELKDLPRERKRELVGDITDHIEARRAELSLEDEAAVAALLDSLGEPRDIAAEARERLGASSTTTSRTHDSYALLLIVLGSAFVPVFGWIAGIVLLWTSTTWTRIDKIVGTVLVPGGLGLALYLWADYLISDPGTSSWYVSLLVLLSVVPFVTGAYLARQMHHRRRI
jgi:Co/Zn/Cd efflux system component